jgi:uncharacterized protein YlxW (UPF0749 family)
MKDKLLPPVVFLTGLALSGVAGFYSIVGLTAIFSGAFWPIVIMGTTLEIAKLVSISWLHHNWSGTSKLVRGYLVFAVLVLMLITSMGIFGFLSKAHIEQQLKMDTGVQTEVQSINNKIRDKERIIADYDKQVSVIDKSLDVLIQKGQADKSLDQANKQKKSREDLIAKKETEEKQVSSLREKKIQLESEVKKIEAEVGPIKYIAEMIFDASDNKILEKAVKLVIIILILVFDPLAVLLLLAFNISINKKSPAPQKEPELTGDYDDMEYVTIKPYRRKRGRKKKNSEIADSSPTLV